MNIDSAMNIDPELQAQVNAQLLEQGAFTALAWLIDCGRLAGDVYDGWRRRDIEFLDDALRPKAPRRRCASAAIRNGIASSPDGMSAHRTHCKWICSSTIPSSP